MLGTTKATWQNPLRDETNNELSYRHIPPKPPLNQSKENRKPPTIPASSPTTKNTTNKPDNDDRSLKRRKISFKIKATLSQSRWQTTLSANKVAQLTQKFNQLIQDEPKIARAVRRANSVRLKEDVPMKRPSIKPKPSAKENVIRTKRISVRRKCSINKKPIKIDEQPTDQVDSPCPRTKKAVSPPGSVKAAIEIFERRKSETVDNVKGHKYERTNSNELKPNEQLINSINKILLSGQEVVNCPPVVQKPIVPHKSKNLIRNDELSKSNLTELQHYFKKQLNKKEGTPRTSSSLATLVNLQLDPRNPPLESTVQPQEERPLLDTTGLSSQTIEDTELEVKQIPIVNNGISITFGDETKPIKGKGGLYEGLTLRKTTPHSLLLKMTVAEDRAIVESRRPNNSFLWRSKSKEGLTMNTLSSIAFEENEEIEPQYLDTGQSDIYDHIEQPNEDFEALYDTVQPLVVENVDEGIEKYEKILEKTDAILREYKNAENVAKNVVDESNWQDNHSVHSYESFYNNSNYEEMNLDYEYPKSVVKRSESNVSEGIYETLSLKSSFIEEDSATKYIPNKYPDKPLPDLPPLNTQRNIPELPELPDEQIYCSDYESIYQAANITQDVPYELIHPSPTRSDLSSSGSNRDSLISSDQQSNSLYGGRYGEMPSNSGDEWVDVSDPEFDDKCEPGFVIVREGKRHRKNPGWSLKVRDQRRQNPRNDGPEDDASSDHYNHYYESLNSDEDFDSFDSESDDDSFTKINQNDSGVDMGNSQLPEPPGSSGNIYGLTRLAATAGKHMKRLRRNWSLTKNDITKSLSRMTKKKSSTSLAVAPVEQSSPDINQIPVLLEQLPQRPARPAPPPPNHLVLEAPDRKSYQNVEYKSIHSLGRKKNWLKFRRCTSMTTPVAVAMDTADNNLNLTKSTFYLTSEINADTGEITQQTEQPVVPIRRRTKSRPQSPPPPAPSPPKLSTKKATSRSTSWYAECGLFKPGGNGGNAAPLIVAPVPPPLPQRDKNSSTCWYAEVGLYQKKNSVATSPSTSSAGNSSAGGDSSAATDVYYNLRNEEQLEEEENSIYYNEERMKRCQSGDVQLLLLKDEPLYQFYDAAVAESACQETSSDSDYDGYEEIGRLAPDAPPPPPPPPRPVAIRSRWGPGGIGRTLWCEIPEVIQSEILSTLTATQKKVQEAKFELLTSEASYFNSLTLLQEHFISSLNLETLLPLEDRDILFGLIEEVKRSSEAMLSELEYCWQVSILLAGVMDVVLKHSETNLEVYVRYCANQVYLEAVLRRCKEKQPFGEVLKGLEASPTCQALSLYSFLMLPMQRITRMPLLVDAILKRLTENDDEFDACQKVMMKLNEIVMRCNEGARKAERETELLRITRQLEYPAHVPSVDLSPATQRWLVRSGEVTHLVSRNDEVKLTFGKKFTKIPLTLFLFEDLLIITRRKNDDSYTVVHHCPRNFVELTAGGVEPFGLPVKDAQSRHLLFVTLLENQEARTVEMMLSCPSETDRQRWCEALSPPVSDNPYETVYESWDCPQVRAGHRYQAGQPDELTLAKGDVVNVNKKMADGWYHGERIRDGTCGWFPGNHTIEIANPHVRARNLKQRYRLLAFTDNYLNKTK